MRWKTRDAIWTRLFQITVIAGPAMMLGANFFSDQTGQIIYDAGAWTILASIVIIVWTGVKDNF